MTHYRVNFYKHLLSSDGHPFRCLQQSVKIGCARSIERAVLAAKHRFERRNGLRLWDLHADDFDVEIGETGVSYMPSHSASAAPSGGSRLDLVEPIAAGGQRRDVSLPAMSGQGGRELTPLPDAPDLGHVPRKVQGPRIQAQA
jgi:hypothetical protein